MSDAAMNDVSVVRLRDGRSLAYAEYGARTGAPILYCHGAPSSRVEANLFLNPATVADLNLRVIVPDRPGIGRSDFQRNRRIVDWPDDVAQLMASLGIDTFAVMGESGGAPYAAACAALMPNRVRALGLVGCLAPVDDPSMLAALSTPLRMMFRMARSTPILLRLMFGLNLRAVRSGGAKAGARMAASFPEPDRTLLLERAEIRDGFMACFVESCRQGTAGPTWDLRLIAGPWGFELAMIRVPALVWHGERDGNVPIAHGRRLVASIPGCRGTFYPTEAHLSVPLNHHRAIWSAMAATMAV